MAWSYEPTGFNDTEEGNYPGSTIGIRNQIRFILQDNNAGRQLLQDEEIDWIQTQECNMYTMAAACCDMLVARSGNVQSKRIDDFSITYNTTFYRDMAASIRARGTSYQTPYVGGISVSDKRAQDRNGDWVRPKFSRDMHDNDKLSDGVAVEPLDET